jgi:AraC-like DNA-binding protein
MDPDTHMASSGHQGYGMVASQGGTRDVRAGQRRRGVERDQQGRTSGEEQFRHWRESIASIFDVRPLDPDYRETFQGRIDRHNLGVALVGEVSTSAQSYTRSESLIGAVGVDHLLVQLYDRGSTTLDLDGTEVRVEPNDIVVLDLSRPLASHATAMRAFNIVLPRGLLNLNAASLDRAHGAVIPRHSAFGRIAGDYLRTLALTAPDLPAQGSADLIEATAALLSACLAPSLLKDQEAPVSLTASAARLRRFIDHHLSDPALGPELLMRRFAVSRSVLYRLFSPLGGVSDYIRERRLERASLMINSATLQRGGVGALARQLGFPSEDAFSRAFKSRFGHTPRDFARMRNAAPSLPRDGESLTSWLTQLSCR